ncbi:MAG: hypothetical protein ACYC9L_03625 [Sulfuricaulis sp.]
MRKTSPQLRKPRTTVSHDTDLTPQQYREIRRQIKYLDNPVRYVVYAGLSRGRFRCYLNVCTDLFWWSWSRATLFKQERVARLVAKAYSIGPKFLLHVTRVKITAPGKETRRSPKSKR